MLVHTHHVATRADTHLRVGFQKVVPNELYKVARGNGSQVRPKLDNSTQQQHVANCE